MSPGSAPNATVLTREWCRAGFSLPGGAVGRIQPALPETQNYPRLNAGLERNPHRRARLHPCIPIHHRQKKNPAPPSKEVREKVKSLLLRSEAFRLLPPERQQEIARHTVEVADYLAKPEGIPANTIPVPGDRVQTVNATADPYAFGLADATPNLGTQRSSSSTGDDKFVAQGAREAPRSRALCSGKSTSRRSSPRSSRASSTRS